MGTISEFTVSSLQDGLELSAMTVMPEGEVKGIVQFVHGMCEHKERYIPIMEYLSGHGYACIIHDHRGHGKSVKEPEDLGFFYENGAEALVEDIHQMTVYAKETFGDIHPFVLLGHSMGSFAVRCYAKKYDREIDKLIVMGSPSYNPAAGVGETLVKILKKFKGERAHSKLLDYMAIDSGYEKRFAAEKTKHAWVCSDPEVVAAYNADPLCNYTFTINGYENLMKLMAEAYSTKGWDDVNASLPVIFMSGKEDPCAVNDKGFSEAIRNFKSHGYTCVSGKFYKNMRHEILNEKRKMVVYKDILDFIEDNN